VSVKAPDVTLGTVFISNIRIDLELFVPSDAGGPQPFTTTFAIGRMAKPVTLAVWLFRGTCSFEVSLQPHPIGVVYFAASMGMGAQIGAGGFGVSGSIGMDVTASIEYERTNDGGGRITVGGSFSLHGEITVWGVAGASIQAILSLTYHVDTELLRAQGEVIGSVWAFGCTKEWRLQTSEDFALGDSPGSLSSKGRLAAASTGSAGTFGDVYALPEWQSYCAAFA
jgi:hypothetical protein